MPSGDDAVTAPRGAPAIRALTALLSAAGIAVAAYAWWLVATGGWPGAPQDGPGRLYKALMATTALAAGGLGLLVATRARPAPAAQAFGLFLAGVALSWADQGRFYLLRALPGVGEPGAEPGATLPTLVVFYGATALASGAVLRMSQLFPRPLDPAAIRSTPGPAWLRSLQLLLLGPGPAWLVYGLGVWAVLLASRYALPVALSLQVIHALGLSLLFLASSYLRVAWHRGDDEDRRRIFWFLEAGVVGLITLGVAAVVEAAVHMLEMRGVVVLWIHGALPIGLLVMVGVLAVGVLYKGALDSRLVVRKTVVYGATGFILTAVFVGVETLVEEVLATRLALPDRAGGYLAGILAAVVFGPLRGALERRVMRREPVPQNSSGINTR